MKRTLDCASLFDAEFIDTYCGCILEGPYHNLLRSDHHQSLSTTGSAAATLLQPERNFDDVAKTVVTTNSTTIGVHAEGLGRATSGASREMTVAAYPTSVADRRGPCVSVEPTTVSYGCASSTAGSIVAYRDIVDIQARLSSNSQVYNNNNNNNNMVYSRRRKN